MILLENSMHSIFFDHNETNQEVKISIARSDLFKQNHWLMEIELSKSSKEHAQVELGVISFNPFSIKIRGISSALLREVKYRITKYVLKDYLKYKHGCGIDKDWLITQNNSNKWICDNAFHTMNDNGMYCGWIPFTVKYKSDLSLESIALSYKQADSSAITQARKSSLQEYLYQVFDDSVTL